MWNSYSYDDYDFSEFEDFGYYDDWSADFGDYDFSNDFSGADLDYLASLNGELDGAMADLADLEALLNGFGGF